MFQRSLRSFTANSSSWTPIVSLSISNSSMVGASNSVKLIGKGKWGVTGYLAADAVINIGSVNHLYPQASLNGTAVGHTQRVYNFSFGTGIWEVSWTFWTTTTDSAYNLCTRKSNNDITNAAINFEITRAETYQ